MFTNFAVPASPSLRIVLSLSSEVVFDPIQFDARPMRYGVNERMETKTGNMSWSTKSHFHDQSGMRQPRLIMST